MKGITRLAEAVVKSTSLTSLAIACTLSVPHQFKLEWRLANLTEFGNPSLLLFCGTLAANFYPIGRMPEAAIVSIANAINCSVVLRGLAIGGEFPVVLTGCWQSLREYG